MEAPSLPPGPTLLPPLAQTLIGGLFPLETLTAARRRYGDLFRVKNIAYDDPLVYVCHPELVKEIFKGDPNVLRAGEAHWMISLGAGKRSLLVIDEPDHLPMRKLMLPPFHGEAVQRYRELMGEIAAADIETWPVGRPFALQDRTQAITLDVILRTVFGIADGERLGELRDLIPPWLSTHPLVVLWGSRGRWVSRTRPYRRFERLKERVDAIVYDEIRRRRADPDGGEPGSILSLLVKARTEDGEPLTELDLHDQLMTLLLAGHETTATGLAWAVERLLRTPRVLDRLQEELDGDGGGDEYLDAVVKEALRIRPPVIDVGRRLAEPTRVADRLIPAGTVLLPAIALIHLDERFYPDPHEFRPERFLEGQPEPYTWLPFGGGVRRCIGAAFAQLEMKEVLAAIVRRTRLRAARPRRERAVFKHVTVVPLHGCRVVLEQRVTGPQPAPAEPRAPALSAG